MTSFARAALAIAAVTCAAPATAGTYRFPAGTPLQLATLTDVDTRHVRSGDRFYLTVAAPLTAGGETIVPVNAMAVGVVGPMERDGGFGKPGRIAVRLLYIDTPRMRIPLVGDADARGRSARIEAATTYVFAGLAAASLVHGGSGVIHAGTPVTALLGDDLSVYAADHRPATAVGPAARLRRSTAERARPSGQAGAAPLSVVPSISARSPNRTFEQTAAFPLLRVR